MALVHTGSPTLRRTAWLMLVTDIGFLVYWALIAAHALPPTLMFADYDVPAVAAWNWSFLPLDLTASATGLLALRALQLGRPTAATLLTVSLTLTATAGGMALAYWSITGDLDPTWWLPNAYLLLFPLPLLVALARQPQTTLSPRLRRMDQRPATGTSHPRAEVATANRGFRPGLWSLLGDHWTSANR